MNWKSCLEKNWVKRVEPDTDLIASLRELSEDTQKAARLLTAHKSSQITLLYDAMRMLLEALALEKGFRIYNHECYTHFLDVILEMSEVRMRNLLASARGKHADF